MKIKCPACAKVLSVPETAAGKVVQCPCGKQLRVPGAATAPTPAAPNPVAPQSEQPSAGKFGADTSAPEELTDLDLHPVEPVANPYATTRPSRPDGSDPLQGYAPPSGGGAYSPQVPGGVLATVGQRIAGALVDLFLQMGFAALGAGGGFAMGAIIDSQDPAVAGIMMNLGLYGGMFTMAIINAVLISTSGQSVGKKVVKTRIVDFETGVQSGFVQGFLLRNFVFGIITSIPCIGAVIALVDLIMLFPEPHQTLHDKLARTMVVQA